eukprot:2381185-Amphidinium_carterae.1
MACLCVHGRLLVAGSIGGDCAFRGTSTTPAQMSQAGLLQRTACYLAGFESSCHESQATMRNHAEIVSDLKRHISELKRKSSGDSHKQFKLASVVDQGDDVEVASERTGRIAL